MSQFPPRPTKAFSGSQFISNLSAKDFGNRDKVITEEILYGNFPNFMRQLVPITISEKGNTLIYYVTPDYLCIGNDVDYVRAPLGAQAAQKIADAFDCILPTSKMSNQIWKAAKAKVTPKPLSGMTSNIGGQTYTADQFLKNKMTDTDSFNEHNQLIQKQLVNHKPGELVAGHKKDVIISNELASRPDRVAIHGMHNTNGQAIQGGSWGHNINYRDYSHGVRLVDKQAQLNGKTVDLVRDVLQNPNLAYLVSDEGPLKFVSYQYDKQNNQIAKKDNTSIKGRLSLLERLDNYLDTINKSI